MTDCWLGREQKCLSMRRFLTLYMTVNWHREFAVNFATFLKVCRDFFTFAPWFSYSPISWCSCFLNVFFSKVFSPFFLQFVFQRFVFTAAKLTSLHIVVRFVEKLSHNNRLKPSNCTISCFCCRTNEHSKNYFLSDVGAPKHRGARENSLLFHFLSAGLLADAPLHLMKF